MYHAHRLSKKTYFFYFQEISKSCVYYIWSNLFLWSPPPDWIIHSKAESIKTSGSQTITLAGATSEQCRGQWCNIWTSVENNHRLSKDESCQGAPCVRRVIGLMVMCEGWFNFSLPAVCEQFMCNAMHDVWLVSTTEKRLLDNRCEYTNCMPIWLSSRRLIFFCLNIYYLGKVGRTCGCWMSLRWCISSVIVTIIIIISIGIYKLINGSHSLNSVITSSIHQKDSLKINQLK